MTVLKNGVWVMNSIKRSVLLIALYLLSASCVDAEQHDDNGLAISGFARVVGGYLDTDKARYQGYENALSFSEMSLAAIQADYKINDYFSASAQLLAHSSENRDSGIEWLYLTYMPNESLQFNAGRLRTPFLKYSDVIDVGFAYPWISPPQQLYSSILFSHYEGINARYRTRFNDFSVDFEAYYGSYQDDMNMQGVSAEVDIDELYGGIVEVNYGGFQLRLASIASQKIEAEVDSITPLLQGLNSAGYSDTAARFQINDGAHSVLIGASFDSLDWFIGAEWMKITSDIDILSTLDSVYLTGGYYLDNVLLHATFTSSRQASISQDNPVPLGVSDELDQLHFTVNALNSFFPEGDLDSLTLGARWDFRTNMALKAEVSLLDGRRDASSFFEIIEGNEDFNRSSTLYQFALEWVF